MTLENASDNEFANAIERMRRFSELFCNHGAAASPVEMQRLATGLTAELEQWFLQTPAANAPAALGVQWSGVAQAVGAEFMRRIVQGDAGATPRAQHDVFIECAEHAYLTTVSSNAFCRLQSEIINASLSQLALVRANIEQAGRVWGVPGWGTIRAQNKEIRALRANAAAKAATGGIPGTLPNETSRLGCTVAERVWSRDKVSLLRYRPPSAGSTAGTRPVLICFALVNRPYILDLRPENSFVRALLDAGLEVYLIDWGYADGADCDLTLGDYVQDYLHGCVLHILKASGSPALNLLGVCQGGVISLCYAALRPKLIENLITMVTPADFQTPSDVLSRWAQGIDAERLRVSGNVPGQWLTSAFMALNPFKLVYRKYLATLERTRTPKELDFFMAMERWIADSPDQPAAALAQYIEAFYQRNAFVNGDLELGGRRVDLKRVRQPLLNIFALDDHIVPPASARALAGLVRSRSYSELEVKTGHIGMYVSSSVRGSIAPRIAHWLRSQSTSAKAS